METRNTISPLGGILKSKCKRRLKSVFSQRKSQYNLNVKSSKKLRQFKENTFRLETSEMISIGKTYTEGSSSEQERKVNALASGAEEGRDKLR